MKTSELTGAALNWAVAKCEEPLGGYKTWVQTDLDKGILHGMRYSTDWDWGGPIIERERIGVWPSESGEHDGEWCARMIDTYITYSSTPLIAAMRCYVTSKLGGEVEVPEELKVGTK